MTQPKFPWALLVIIAMFTWVAVTAPTLWIQVFAVIAVVTSAAAAIYQVIPRKDVYVDEDELDPADDPWSDDNRP